MYPRKYLRSLSTHLDQYKLCLEWVHTLNTSSYSLQARDVLSPFLILPTLLLPLLFASLFSHFYPCFFTQSVSMTSQNLILLLFFPRQRMQQLFLYTADPWNDSDHTWSVFRLHHSSIGQSGIYTCQDASRLDSLGRRCRCRWVRQLSFSVSISCLNYDFHFEIC